MSGKIQNLLNEAEKSGEGKSSVTSARRDFETAENAGKTFARLRQRLFDVNRWEKFSGAAAFQLFGETGQMLETETAQKENFIRITLPGSGKHDWVKIIDIHDAAGEVVITVRPSYDPTEKEADEKKSTSHFFTSEATNNFCLRKKDSALAVYVIGLHEKPNLTESEGVLEAARNAATTALGWLGFQKIEWQTFCENFLQARE
jgi:hypothetical protein